MGREIHQVVAVIEGLHFDILGQYLVVEFRNFCFYGCQYLPGVFSFTHHHRTGNNIIAFAKTSLPYPGHGTFFDLRYVFDKYRVSTFVDHRNVFDIIDGVDQTDTTYDIGLSTFFDHIATDIEVTFADSIVNL
ncbi:hypothetical protein D3C80_912760 [compost metagenome]